MDSVGHDIFIDTRTADQLHARQQSEASISSTVPYPPGHPPSVTDTAFRTGRPDVWVVLRDGTALAARTSSAPDEFDRGRDKPTQSRRTWEGAPRRPQTIVRATGEVLTMSLESATRLSGLENRRTRWVTMIGCRGVAFIGLQRLRDLLARSYGLLGSSSCSPRTRVTSDWGRSAVRSGCCLFPSRSCRQRIAL
jgi:hypothetical protein